MTKIDLAIIKVSTPDSYCGNDWMCAEGGTQVLSLFTWILFIAIIFSLGSPKKSKRKR